MEASSTLFFSPVKPLLPFNLCSSSSSSSSSSPRHLLVLNFQPRPLKTPMFPPSSRGALSLSPPFAVAEALEQVADTSDSPRGASHKIDKSGRFCSPRAARELALLIAYAACLEGTDPVRLLDKRVNAKREPGYVFDKAALLQYDHMSFGGAPVEAGTEEEAEELMVKNERDSAIEAEVLSAPPKLVYNRFVLRLTREILGAVVDQWNQHVLVIDKIIPQNWKSLIRHLVQIQWHLTNKDFALPSQVSNHINWNVFSKRKQDQPAARILELCILHLAMAEITAIGTRHQIVINEAVDLAKRFCDGCAPRIINGCLRTFVKDFSAMDAVQS